MCWIDGAISGTAPISGTIYAGSSLAPGCMDQARHSRGTLPTARLGTAFPLSLFQSRNCFPPGTSGVKRNLPLPGSSLSLYYLSRLLSLLPLHEVGSGTHTAELRHGWDGGGDDWFHNSPYGEDCPLLCVVRIVSGPWQDPRARTWSLSTPRSQSRL